MRIGLTSHVRDEIGNKLTNFTNILPTYDEISDLWQSTIDNFLNKYQIRSGVQQSILKIWDHSNDTSMHNINLLDALFHAWNRIQHPSFKCRGNFVDVQFQRHKEWPDRGCILLHEVQGVAQYDMILQNVWGILARFTKLRDFNNLRWPENKKSAMRRADEFENEMNNQTKSETKQLTINYKLKPLFKTINDTVPNHNNVSVIDQKRIMEQYIQQVTKQRMHNHTRFCAFAVKGFYMWTHYAPDGLVRQAFHRLMNMTYKHCDMVGWHDKWTPKSIGCDSKAQKPYGLPLCQTKYKFTISMENSFSHGYLTEKLYSSLFAGSMPIYFGATDIARYINVDRIIHCHFSEININRMRFIQSMLGKEKFGDREQEQLYNFAISYMKPDLLKCIDKVKQVDQNDTLYEWKLSQPVFPNNQIKNTHYDHTIVAQNIIDILKYLKSPLFS